MYVGHVSLLALSNLWLDDGNTIANFYDKHGLTQQGNVEFMRNFGLENNLYFALTLRQKKYVSLFWQQRSPWSQYVWVLKNR